MMYKSFYGYLMAIIVRYTNNVADSEELVNDSFIKIFDNINKFQFPSNSDEIKPVFKGWISKIASRTTIDKLRTRKHFLSVDDLGEDEHPAEHVNVISEIHVNEILALLNHLPETYRFVFNLYEVEGFKHEEIAKMLQIPESTSRVYLTRAKNKLRILYKNTLINSYKQNG